MWRSGAAPLEVLAEEGVVGRWQRCRRAAPGSGEVAWRAAGPVVGLVLVVVLVGVGGEELLVVAVAVLVGGVAVLVGGVVVGVVLVVWLVWARLLVVRAEHGLVLVVVDDHPPDDALHAGATHGVRLLLLHCSAAGRVGGTLKVLRGRR